MRRGLAISSRWRAMSRAAAPLTCGAAMLVPSMRWTPQLTTRGGDLLPRRHEVGLAPAVACRAAAREIADAVIVRIDAVRGADGDHVLGVAGIGDAGGVIARIIALVGLEGLVALVPAATTTTTPVPTRRVAFVADRGAAAGEAHHLVRHRERQVHAVDERQLLVPVQVLARTAAAYCTVNSSLPVFGLEDAQVVEPDLRADADQVRHFRIVLRLPVAPEDAGDVRPVPDLRLIVIVVMGDADERRHDLPVDLAADFRALLQVIELLLIFARMKLARALGGPPSSSAGSCLVASIRRR